MTEPTSGTALVDQLIDGVHIGDNLVLQGEDGTPLPLLVERFVAATRGEVPLVLVRIAAPWTDDVPDGVTVLDWSAVRTGAVPTQPNALAVDATVDDALDALRAADERVGRGAAFVFDRLTDAQEAWGADAALELFLWACPRLYRRRSLALWPITTEAHRPTFLRRLAEITQVVVELTREDDDRVRLTVREADGRRSAVAGRTIVASVEGDDLHAVDAPTSTRERLGTMLREQRLARGIGQAEVARRVGISPSALSQVERGVRGPSGDTLVRLWEVLGVSIGPTASTTSGYRVERRSGRERRRLQPGLVGELIVDDSVAGQVWLLEVAPGASGDRPPFTVKGAEIATVLRGVVDLSLEGRPETLSEGDALVTTGTSVAGWANPGPETAELLWTIR